MTLLGTFVLCGGWVRRSKAAGSRARGAADKEKRNTTSLVQQTAEQRASKAVPAPHANAELMESIAIQVSSPPQYFTSLPAPELHEAPHLNTAVGWWSIAVGLGREQLTWVPRIPF